MKKIMILVLTTLLFLTCGCIQQNTIKSITMKELNDDIQTNLSINLSVFTIGFKSFNESDTVTIVDTIKNIVYDQESNTTEFLFDVEFNSSFLCKPNVFKGDLRNLYSIGDKIKITVTVKRVIIPLEVVNFTITYDLEIFEELWVGEEYFKSNIMNGNSFKPLSKSLIEKI